MQRNVDELAYTEARRVLRSLLLGSDPITHERLSAECVVMQAETKTALALGWKPFKRPSGCVSGRTKSVVVSHPLTRVDQLELAAGALLVVKRRREREKAGAYKRMGKLRESSIAEIQSR